jgi:hypothetical protein
MHVTTGKSGGGTSPQVGRDNQSAAVHVVLWCAVVAGGGQSGTSQSTCLLWCAVVRGGGQSGTCPLWCAVVAGGAGVAEFLRLACSGRFFLFYKNAAAFIHFTCWWWQGRSVGFFFAGSGRGGPSVFFCW